MVSHVPWRNSTGEKPRFLVGFLWCCLGAEGDVPCELGASRWTWRTAYPYNHNPVSGTEAVGVTDADVPEL